MREGGLILAEVRDHLESMVAPGISTGELDRAAERLIREKKAIPAFKGYRGFPASICTSINDTVVHGIPEDGEILENGDILSFDIGLIYRKFYTDTAVTVPVGEIDEASKRLIDVTRVSLERAIRLAHEGNHLSDLSHAVQEYVEENGYSVVRQFVGHGIGKAMHEEPQIPNFGEPGEGPLLRSGMVLAIEPMVNAGGYEVRLLKDGWRVITADGARSAHFEHTVAVTTDEPAVLTKL